MVNGIWSMLYGVWLLQYHYVLCNVAGKVQQRIREWRVRLPPSSSFTANKKNSVKSCDNHMEKQTSRRSEYVDMDRWVVLQVGISLCVLPVDCSRWWPTVPPAVCGLSEINIRPFGTPRRASGWKATEQRRIVRETMQAERDIRVRVRVRVRVPIPAPKPKLVLARRTGLAV